MDPQEQEPRSLGLPPVKPEGSISIEQPSQGSSNETISAVAVEQGVTGPAPANPAAAQASPAATPPPMTDPATLEAQAAAIASTMPPIADDTDLIEKEWVDKAKAIVEQTAHDPHLQNQEINKVKIDYLKKRYNKDVKLTDD